MAARRVRGDEAFRVLDDRPGRRKTAGQGRKAKQISDLSGGAQNQISKSDFLRAREIRPWRGSDWRNRQSCRLSVGVRTPDSDSPMTKTQVEVITSVERRRRWSRAEKERIVAAALEPGAIASAVAREAGIHASQLYRWRQELCGPARAAPGFAAVTIAAEGGVIVQHFPHGDDYVKTGKAVLIEKDAQFQNAFGAMAHSTVMCTYDLNQKKVVDIIVTPN
jgi:transposase-like protein